MNIQQIDNKIAELTNQKEKLIREQKSNKDKPIYTKIPELGIEISPQIYNNKTYAEILKLVKEEQIATVDILFKLRSLTDKYPQFKDFWVLVPNPDKISRDNNYVARFLAGSVRAYLDCYGNPAYQNAGLGVFLYRRLK